MQICSPSADSRLKVKVCAWKFINLYPVDRFLVLKVSSVAYIQVYLRLNFFMEANTMSPDQTAPLGAV